MSMMCFYNPYWFENADIHIEFEGPSQEIRWLNQILNRFEQLFVWLGVWLGGKCPPPEYHQRWQCALTKGRSPVSAMKWDIAAFCWQPVLLMAASDPCSGSPQICQGVLKTLGWPRWGRLSSWWDEHWPCMCPPKFQSWSLSSTQLRLSWRWGPSWLARHNLGSEGQRWSGCPAWHPGL